MYLWKAWYIIAPNQDKIGGGNSRCQHPDDLAMPLITAQYTDKFAICYTLETCFLFRFTHSLLHQFPSYVLDISYGSISISHTLCMFKDLGQHAQNRDRICLTRSSLNISSFDNFMLLNINAYYHHNAISVTNDKLPRIF